MNHVARIAQLLLEGNVICAYAFHHEYRLLAQNEDIRRPVENVLSTLARELAQSDSGNAFFAAHKELNDFTKQEAKEHYRHIVRDATRLLKVMHFFAEASGQQIYVQAGERIAYSDLINALTYSQALQEQLQILLEDRSGADVSQLIDKLINRLVNKDRLLKLIDKHKRIYQFTGRLELIQQSLTFVAENNNVDQISEIKSMQKGLL